MEWIEKITSSLSRGQAGSLTGLSGSARGFVLEQLHQKQPAGCSLAITATEEQAYDLMRTWETFAGPGNILLFAARNLIFQRQTIGRSEIQRMHTLQTLMQAPQNIRIITTAAALLTPLLPSEDLAAKEILLRKGTEIPLLDLAQNLHEVGYRRADTLTAPGEYALRGGILDVFPIGEEFPFRIEFWGDEPENIRSFDLNSQRSLEQRDFLSIPPIEDLSTEEDKRASLLDYLPEDTLLWVDEPLRIQEEFERQKKRLEHYWEAAQKENGTLPQLGLWDYAALKAQMEQRTRIFHCYFPSQTVFAQNLQFQEHVAQQEMESFFRREDIFMERIHQWVQAHYTIHFMLNSEDTLQRLKAKLLDAGVNDCIWSKGSAERGFVSSSLAYALVAEPDLGGKRRLGRHKKAASQGERVLLENLQVGDYVVHEQYGIGIFHGITQVKTFGVVREYLLLQYAGTDKLYLPIEKLDLLFRYNGTGEGAPKLNRLGGHEWEKTKAKVVQSIQDMADDLLKLYATRSSQKGYAFRPDVPWQQEFEEKFPYQETPGQLQAIADTKRDMELPRPMDRLICGDVGYGKTEVCLRAAFKAVMDGKQVAMLVPTTVLAEQHYETFKKRFQDYPIHIDVLSRFRTPAQQKQTLKDMAAGAVDVVIATHRLLSKDIQFHDLGLLIVDEEHRFGVAQKEKIKQLKTQVDVLSLSATPIPRSLHMAMTGLRDLSVIDTAPPQRYPVTTYVLEYDEEMILQAIRSEMERQGQIFFVHNRISDIAALAEHLQERMPECRIVVGHGQMKEQELEEAIHDFMEHKYDLFLCTTIIESGLDIPNVNTMIVDMADHMGLAQLYQLRGRVGRSNRMAYAYITYRPQKSLTEDAQKRLNALREFNEVGAGMKIALRDLEIRGAGNILGAEQHGHIHAIGFDLYCRIMEEETAKLRGTSVAADPMPQLDVDVDLYIPEDYIPDSGTRLQMYRRLLMATSQEEVDEIHSELEDRFGSCPPMVDNLIQIALLRLKAHSHHIKSMKKQGNELILKLDFDTLVRTAQGPLGKNARITGQDTLKIRLDGKNSLEDLKQILTQIG